IARFWGKWTKTGGRGTRQCSGSATFRRSVRAWRKPANGMPPPPHPVTPRRMRRRLQRRRVRPGSRRNSATPPDRNHRKRCLREIADDQPRLQIVLAQIADHALGDLWHFVARRAWVDRLLRGGWG